VGTVLVNGDGRTLYMLTAEQGGKIVCTVSSGCTKYWSPATLPVGVSSGVAGSGAQASLLGTVKDASGQSRLTYGGWPVYTFVGDTSSGVAKGQGVSSFGGTWWAINAAGMPVTSPSGGSTSTTKAPPGYSGY
jgi:predicted lipoprotein with Yx(FWY)xxD motif